MFSITLRMRLAHPEESAKKSPKANRKSVAIVTGRLLIGKNVKEGVKNLGKYSKTIVFELTGLSLVDEASSTSAFFALAFDLQFSSLKGRCFMSTDRPVHEIRMGRIKAAIWRNENESGSWFSVQLTRIYKSEKGWETSNSFSRDELPLVSKVADLAHTWIYTNGNDRDDSDADDRPKSNSRKRATVRSN
jgi:hypothetical protein